MLKLRPRSKCTSRNAILEHEISRGQRCIMTRNAYNVNTHNSMLSNKKIFTKSCTQHLRHQRNWKRQKYVHNVKNVSISPYWKTWDKIVLNVRREGFNVRKDENKRRFIKIVNCLVEILIDWRNSQDLFELKTKMADQRWEVKSTNWSSAQLEFPAFRNLCEDPIEV